MKIWFYIQRLIALALLILLSPFSCLHPCYLFMGQGASYYSSYRVGLNARQFRFLIRSMVVNADSSGVTSTSNKDRRITPIGSM